MSEFNIFRPLTAEEQNEYTPVGTKTILDIFLKELAKKISHYQKLYIPYDSFGARMDFEDNVRQKMHEMSAAIDKSKVEKLDFGNLDKYADTSRFEYIGEKEQLNTRLVAGIKQEVVIGKRYTFLTKSRGNKVSMLVDSKDVDKVEKFIKENWLDVEKKEQKVEENKPTKKDLKENTK